MAAMAATWPRNRTFASPERLYGRPVECLTVRAADGVETAAWLVEAQAEPRGAVVLAAGIGGDRRAMQGRARFYLDRGWSTLLVDLRGTGQSAPERIAMGYHEALDLCAWRRLLRGRGHRTVGVHGQSLGAAAAVYTAIRGEPAARWQFVVLEACYRDVRAALHARMVGVPEVLLLPMVCCAEWLLGVDADDLDPVAAITRLDTPLLLVCGEHDQKVGPNATAGLLAASPADDKRAVTVAGAGHVDLWGAGGLALQRELDAFLARR